MIKAVINGKLVFPEEIREGNLLMEGDRIIASGDCLVPEGAEIIDAGGLFVGPGLFDQHVHGYSRYGERMSIAEDPVGFCQAHLKHGTTSITPGIGYDLPKEPYKPVTEAINAAMEKGDTNIVGMHYEGPFINPLHGANSQTAWKFSEEDLKEILELGKGNILHLTYAPEMPGAKIIESLLKEYGIIPDIGHTRSDPENIYRAVKAGARIVTHMYDAMGNYKGCDKNAFAMTDDPQESVSDILLSLPGLYYELICDSFCAHVSAVSIRQTYRTAGEDFVVCISDSVGYPRCCDPRDYPPSDPRSAVDLNWTANGELCGSMMTVSMSVKNFMKHTDCGIRVAFKAGSTNSAKALGLYEQFGSIHAGKKANIIFVDDSFTVKNIIFHGSLLPEVRTE